MIIIYGKVIGDKFGRGAFGSAKKTALVRNRQTRKVANAKVRI